MSTPRATAEVEPVSWLILHPLLQDPKFLAAAIVLVVSLILVSALRPSGKGGKGRRGGIPTVVLVGPCDGGKTALYAKLTKGIYPQTHTSIESSNTTINLLSPDDETQSKAIRLVDLPGHPRLRDEIKLYKDEISTIVFVVDTTAIVRAGSSTAEQIPQLLSLLSNLARKHDTEPRIIFLAHKSDLLIRPSPPIGSIPSIPSSTRNTAVERLKSILTREMDKLKSARSSTSGRIEGMGKVVGSSNGFIGKLTGSSSITSEDEEGEEEGLIWGGRGSFRWEDVEGVEVLWASSALGVAKTGKEKEVAKDATDGDGLDDLKRLLFDA